MASVTGVVVVLWVMLASVPKSSAIPAFSRKYQTSCTTCHNNYPELNDFGEAFKKNGFKFPKDDEVFVQGTLRCYFWARRRRRKRSPGAVYPGEIPRIPRQSRSATRGTSLSIANSPPVSSPQNGFYAPHRTFFAPNILFTIISAGSFGQNLSFWIDDDISVGGSKCQCGLHG